MSPEQFARRPLRAARNFVVGTFYPGYGLDGDEAMKIQEWLGEYRFWQKKLGSPYLPWMGYRFDVVTYAQEPSKGWQAFDSAYVRVPRATLEAKRDEFRRAGWKVSTVEAFERWEPKLRRFENGVEMAALPWCKGESNRRKTTEFRQQRCASQTPILDPQKVIPQVISHCLEALKSFRLGGVALACKRAFYSPNPQGEFKRVFGPGPGFTPVGGPLIAPPFEPGYWDDAWMQLARALRDEGVLACKEERPRGYPDRSGASWLAEDLRASVTEEGGPERL